MVCTTLDKESPIQAVCPNWARTDLCGGREVTRVPTAKVVGTRPNRRFGPIADVASALTDFCFFDPKRPRVRRYSRWFCCDP